MFRTFTLLMFLLLAWVSHAQPQPVDCTTAAQLCAQQPLSGNNTGVVNTMPAWCPGGPQTDQGLWYSFTSNSQGGPVTVTLSDIDCATVTGMGEAMSVVVFGGPDCNSLGNVSDCVTGSDQVSVTSDALAPGTTYWVHVAGVMGASAAAQCEFQLEITGPGADVLGVDLIVSDDVQIGIGESTQLNAAGGTGHTWTPTTGLSNANIPNPIASPPSSITYTVTVQVGDCEYTAEVSVDVIRRISPPNTFTPNGDGRNDVWLITGIDDYPGAEVLIFDRWGQRVYASTGYREPWDGTNNGARLPDGTYYYYIQLNQLEGRSPPYTGFISIIR